MNADERAELVRLYRQGPAAVRAALEGITSEELDRSSGDEWSPRQVVHHLADSEMTSAIRIRKLLAEENPVIYGYDEKSFARRFTLDRPIESSLLAFEAARETTAEILERLADDDWSRTGWHTESGPYGVETWLRIYAEHGHDHAEQIRRARG
jgi:hypothetical protein